MQETSINNTLKRLYQRLTTPHRLVLLFYYDFIAILRYIILERDIMFFTICFLLLI